MRAAFLAAEARRLPERLNPLDTLLWRCEAEPRLRSPVLLLGLFDTAPAWDRFVADHDLACRILPRLCERPAASALLPSLPLWERDPDFDLRHHVRRAGPAGPGLLDLAESLFTAPFDANRPLWESVLVEGVEWRGKAYPAAWLLRVHHCLCDGMALFSWLTRLLGADWPWSDGIAGRPRPDLLRGGVQAGLDLVARPRRTLTGLARTLRGELANLPTRADDRSPLLSGRGTARRLETLTVPADDFWRAAAKAGGTVNEAFVLAVIAGFRRYHERLGEVPGTLAVGLPVAVPGPREWAGNRIGAARFSVPMAGDARQRLEVRARMARATADAVPPWMDLALAGMSQLPGFLIRDLGVRMGAGQDVQTSLVPGPETLRMAGSTIAEMYSFGPNPGSAAMLVMISGHSSNTVGLTIDPAAITDISAFMECMDEGFEEALDRK